MSPGEARRSALRISKNAGMLLAGTVMRMVAGFAFVLYCADALGVEAFGKFSISIHYFELFLSLTSTAAGILLTRDIARWKKHTSQLFSAATTIVLGLCCLAPLPMVGLGIAFNYSQDTLFALGIASVALFPAAISALLEALFVGKERAEFVTVGTAIESTLRIGLSFLVLFMDGGLLALIGVLFLVRTVLLITYLICAARLGFLHWHFDWQRTRRFANRWRVFAAENWMATIYTNLDVIVLSWISGEVAAGLYSAAWKVVRLGTVVAKSYTTAIFPVMSRMVAESRQAFSRLYRHTIRVMCTIALPVIAAVTVIPHRIIDVLYNEEYVDAAPVLRVLIWVLLLEFLNPFLSHTLFAQGKQHQSMRVAGISLSINIFATYFLVHAFGAEGAAMGTVLGGSIATVCYLLYAMPRDEILNTLNVVARVALASIAVGFVLYYVRDGSWFALIAVSLLVYPPLLYLFGAVRLEDVQFFRTTFLAKAST